MEHNYRELGLHSIIKSQQSKIHELKEQLKLANQREQNHYQQFAIAHKKNMEEKDKLIEKLKKQLSNVQLSKTSSLIQTTSRMESQIQSLQSERDTYKLKLQSALKKYDHDISEKQSQIQELTTLSQQMFLEINQKKRVKDILNSELNGLNLFYKNAINELPKKKQTLLWVDNLINYMEKSQQYLENNNKEIKIAVKNSLQSLKSELINLVQKNTKNQNHYQQELIKISLQIRQLANVSKKTEQNMIKENQYFIQLLKTQKQANNQDQIANLQKQLLKIQQKHQNQIVFFKQTIKNLQNEKKNILIGFQQLKNLYENKEKTYKEEINLLKDQINIMLKKADERENQFQDEIRILGTQVSAISQRYYQNIQIPNRMINQSLLKQFQKIRIEVTKLQQTYEFNNHITQLENKMRVIIETFKKPQSSSEVLQKYIQHSSSGIRALEKYLTVIEKNVDHQFRMQAQRNPTHKQIEFEIKILEMKENQNKLIYQLNLMKKHNSRLQELIANTQKKLTTTSSKSVDGDMKKILFWQKKAKQIETQFLVLKEQKIRVENMLNKQIWLMKQEISDFKKRIQNLKKQPQDLINIMENVKNSNQKIYSIVKVSDKQIKQIENSLNLLNNILIKPINAFENLVKQVVLIKDQKFPVSQIDINPRKKIQDQSRQIYMNSINSLKSLTNKRNQVNNAISRQFSELIKTIRENIISRPKIQEISIQNRENQKMNPKVKFNNAQKRLKQICQQRLKDRQLILQSLQKVQATTKIIQNKTNTKKVNYNYGHQIQSIFDKKIAILNSQQIKQHSDVTKIAKQALLDIQTKLKETIIQNQGLLKQIAITNKINQLHQ